MLRSLVCFWRSLEVIYPSNCGHAERIDHNFREFLTTGAAKETTLVMIRSTDSGELLLSRLTTPLTATPARGKIHGDRSAKFVVLHKGTLQICADQNETVHTRKDNPHRGHGSTKGDIRIEWSARERRSTVIRHPRDRQRIIARELHCSFFPNNA